MHKRPWRMGQTCHADRAYVSGFTEKKGMEKGGGKGLWGQDWWKRD